MGEILPSGPRPAVSRSIWFDECDPIPAIGPIKLSNYELITRRHTADFDLFVRKNYDDPLFYIDDYPLLNGGAAKGKGSSGSNRKAESTDAPERGGLLRSSDEAAVMVMERRGRVIDDESGQLVTGGA